MKYLINIMIKIFNVDTSGLKLFCNGSNFEWLELKNSNYLKNENFERTPVGIGSESVLDLTLRSSWTNKFAYFLNFNHEINDFLNKHGIIGSNPFQLLKYDVGDFFLNHKDTKINSDIGSHEYTCLIFCPFTEDELEGGNLIFKSHDDLYVIKFNPSVETNKNNFVMLIFDVNMYHKVEPIIRGTRWVFKKPLFVKNKVNVKSEEVDELTDGGGGGFFGKSGDY